MIEKNDINKKLKQNGITIFELMKIYNCSRNTIRNYIKKYNLSTPKGFFKTGKKAGRPKGFRHTKEFKQLLSEKFSGDKNPYFGRKHSADTKQKMSENHADFAGDKNPFKRAIDTSEVKRKEHKDRCKSIWDNRDECWRIKFSEKLSKAMAESKYFQNSKFHKHHESGFYRSDKCGCVFYRSSWEHKLCSALEKDDTVLKFTLEELCIPYKKLGGKNSFTRVDFIVYRKDSKMMIEVKPKALIKYSEQKIKAMKKYCDDTGMIFEVWTKSEIEDYERSIQA